MSRETIRGGSERHERRRRNASIPRRAPKPLPLPIAPEPLTVCVCEPTRYEPHACTCPIPYAHQGECVRNPATEPKR